MENNKPVLTVLVGIPASGKSSYSQVLAEKDNCIVHSSDALRKTLNMSSTDSHKNNDLFQTLYNNIKSDLLQNKNVVFDATNCNAKKRKSLINFLDKVPCYKKVMVMTTPFQTCIERDQSRLGYESVGKEVIMRYVKQFQCPNYWEGWDSIEFCHDYVIEDDIGKYINSLNNELINRNQNNPNHSLTLDKHMEKALNYAIDNNYSFINSIACLFHDVGKVYTGSYENSRGEITNTMHYYSHENVSAYLFVSLYNIGLRKSALIHIANLLQYHMLPYQYRTEEEINHDKYKKRFGEQFWLDILEINKADRFAH